MRPMLRNKPRIMRSAAFRKNAFSSLKATAIGLKSQIKELRTCRFNRLPNASDFRHRQIVHDDDVAALERRSETLLYSKTIGPFIAPSSTKGTVILLGRGLARK
jgi:hypothetical protein